MIRHVFKNFSKILGEKRKKILPLYFKLQHFTKTESLYRSSLNNTTRCEILLNVIERIYEEHPEIQNTIDCILVDVYR